MDADGERDTHERASERASEQTNKRTSESAETWRSANLYDIQTSDRVARTLLLEEFSDLVAQRRNYIHTIESPGTENRINWIIAKRGNTAAREAGKYNLILTLGGENSY